MDTVKEKWEEIIQKLKVEYFLSNISFETWIRPLEVYDIVGDTLYLSINFKASIEHIQNKYLLPLEVCIAEVTGVEYDIKFIPKDIPDSEMAFYKMENNLNSRQEEPKELIIFPSRRISIRNIPLIRSLSAETIISPMLLPLR